MPPNRGCWHLQDPLETRFEFHSRDTALFYRITGEPILREDDARWISSLRIQRQIRSVLEWKEASSPLYCGLSILMNLREPVLEKKSLDDKLNKLKGTLRGRITANGLIPEQLNTQGADESQKPAVIHCYTFPLRFYIYFYI